MLAVRTVLACALVGVGGFVLVRMLSFGLRPEIVPGVVLSAAMIALGVHRLALIRRVRKGTG